MGKMLVVADLSSIESRILGWLAGAKDIQRVFALGMDTYKDFAARWFGVPYSEVTPEQRKLAKPPFLGCGYGLGVEGLLKYADSMGVEMSSEQARSAVERFRQTYAEVPALWKECLHAAAEVCGGGTWEGHGLFWKVEEDFLTVRLPSGRKLYYYQPRWEEVEVPWGGTQFGLTYMGQDQYTRKWTRQTTHGGKLCLSGDTLVLTDSGWKEIREISAVDRVFDGVEFIKHGGRMFNGVQDCVTVDGVQMTPDHEVLTHHGWQEASQLQRPYGETIRYVDRDPSFSQQWDEMVLDLPVRLREALYKMRGRSNQGQKGRTYQQLRVQNKRIYRAKECPSWYVETSCVCGVAVDERQVSFTLPPSLEKLWGKGNQSLRKMAQKFRVLLGRQQKQVQTGVDNREERQSGGLYTEKRRMGFVNRSSPKSEKRSSYRHSPFVSNDRDLALHAVLPLVSRAVYDIGNAGPRKRFVVLGDEGPFIVHNCENLVQAIARDILVSGMLLYTQLGGTIVGHVHDEAIAEEDEGQAQVALESLNKCLSTTPAWARGLLLESHGYVARRYR